MSVWGDVLKQVDGLVQTSTAMVGVQDFVLSHTEDLTTSEAVVYFQAEDGENLASGAGEDKKLHGGTLSARHGGVRRVRQYFRFDILQ